MRRRNSKFVERSDNKFLQIARDFLEICPKCNSIHVFVRQRKRPKYYCNDCKNEFDDPKAKIAYKTYKQKMEQGKKYSNPDR